MQLQTIGTDETIQFMTNQLAETSKRTYTSHIKYFSNWLAQNGLTFFTARDIDISEYRKHILETHAKKSASTMLTVVKQLYAIAKRRNVIESDPAQYITGIKADTDETPYRTLTTAEARMVLNGINTSTLRGIRDYMIVAILIRTGLRRSEIAKLMTSSLFTEQGHTVLKFYGKGNKRRKVALADDVAKKLNDYMKRANLTREKEAALFYSLTRNKGHNLSGNQIALIVHRHTKAADVEISPHSLRATFITGALAGGAKIEKVQRFVGHASPVTTQHYQTDKDNITDHAGLYFPEI